MTKTAIQVAIERIEKMISISNFKKWGQLKQELLAIEKMQIETAFEDGIDQGTDWDTIDPDTPPPVSWEDPEAYYNAIYNQSKVKP